METLPSGIKKYEANDNATVENFNINADLLDTKLTEFEEHTAAIVLDHPDGSVTDAKIGSRTINDASAPAGDSGGITTLFGALANMVKSITGKGNWRTSPATTLEAANTHMNATNTVHGATSAATADRIPLRDANGRFKVGAPSAADDVARKDTVDNAINTIRTSANITYYIRTDGNDNNDGLANLSGRAFKTIGKALSLIPKIVHHTITINVAAGTYPESPTFIGYSGAGSIYLLGDTVVSDNYVLNSVNIYQSSLPVTVRGFRLLGDNITACNAAFSTGVIFSHCKVVNASGSVAFAFNRSTGSVSLCEISNRNVAVFASNASKIFVNSNTGANNSYVFSSADTSEIGKYASQPTGTTIDVVDGGGEIRSSGVINPWGTNNAPGNNVYYQKFPSGTIIQWGTATLSSGATVTLPVTFPTGVRSIVVTLESTTGYASFGSWSASNFKVYHSLGTATPFSFIAIGY